MPLVGEIAGRRFAPDQDHPLGRAGLLKPRDDRLRHGERPGGGATLSPPARADRPPTVTAILR